MDAVLGSLLGAAVVPPVPSAGGDRQVRLLDTALDLLEESLAQIGEVRRLCVGVGVLRFEVGDDLCGFLGAKPFVGIVEGVTVMGAEGRAAVGGRGVSHRLTLSQVELTGTGRVGEFTGAG